MLVEYHPVSEDWIAPAVRVPLHDAIDRLHPMALVAWDRDVPREVLADVEPYGSHPTEYVVSVWEDSASHPACGPEFLIEEWRYPDIGTPRRTTVVARWRLMNLPDGHTWIPMATGAPGSGDVTPEFYRALNTLGIPTDGLASRCDECGEVRPLTSVDTQLQCGNVCSHCDLGGPG